MTEIKYCSEDEITDYIIDNLAIKTQEKNKYGEVFTPPDLIKEMLDKLPSSVWKNKDYKWLDPANGIGNFPMIVYFKLMKELDCIPLSERSDYIIKNMLYMVELNPKNVEISRKIFGKDANIYCNDYLKFNLSEKFDVVMGNPPFQGSGRKKPYIQFIDKSINHLNEGGYLLFVTPKMALGFMLGHEVSQRKISKMYNIIYINNNNDIKKKYFPKVGSDFCWYIIQNSDYMGITEFINETNLNPINKKLRFGSYLIGNDKYDKLFNKLIKINENQWSRKAARIEDEYLVDKKTITHINKIYYKIATNEENDKIKWSEKTHPDMNKYKVLYPTLGTRYIVDRERNLFPGTSFVVYILCASLKECENIMKLSKSKLFKFLTDKVKTQRSPRDFVWRNLIKPGEFNISISSDSDIYKFFNLNSNDIKLIENSGH